MEPVAKDKPVILRLAVPSPLRRLFDYLPPVEMIDSATDFWLPGMRLEVPFGNRKLIAVLVEVVHESAIDVARLRHAYRLPERFPLFPTSAARRLEMVLGVLPTSSG